MTSVFMVFEVSASYKIIAPVMVANMLAYIISRRLQPVPFFDQNRRLRRHPPGFAGRDSRTTLVARRRCDVAPARSPNIT
jgi:H+/Cl- antiporter ClcA